MAENIRLNCIKCKKDFEVSLSKKKYKYCSRKCYDEKRLQYTFLNCSICDIKFRTFDHQLKKNRQFCSKKCFGEFNHRYSVEHSHVLAEKRFFNAIEDYSDSAKCWLWKKGKDIDGYGIMRSKNKHVRAHRYSWEIHHSEISEGLFVCHKCDNPSCVNPHHLFLGTSLDNNRDREIKKRSYDKRGENGFTSKLKNHEVLEIRKKLENGEEIKNLAIQFHTSRGNISKIKLRETWKHI